MSLHEDAYFQEWRPMIDLHENYLVELCFADAKQLPKDAFIFQVLETMLRKPSDQAKAHTV